MLLDDPVSALDRVTGTALAEYLAVSLQYILWKYTLLYTFYCTRILIHAAFITNACRVYVSKTAWS